MRFPDGHQARRERGGQALVYLAFLVLLLSSGYALVTEGAGGSHARADGVASSPLLLSHEAVAQAIRSLSHPVSHATPSHPLGIAAEGWTQVSSGTSPSVRAGMGLTYDAADGYVLLFGGMTGTGVLGDTWKFVNGSWSQITVSPAPPAREWPSMTYDAADGYVLLYGGWTGTTHLNDTWKYLHGVWTNLTSQQSSSPSARSGAGMSFDTTSGTVVLFGGVTGATNQNFLDDTWTFQGGKWQNISASIFIRPAPRGNEGMVYDSGDGYLLLFGGQGPRGYQNDTWVFSGGHWSNITKPAAAHPSERSEVAIAYDFSLNTTVLFGGYSPADPNLGDTWTFRAGTWTNLTANLPTSPTGRRDMGASFDSTTRASLFFGGMSTTTSPPRTNYLQDTWYFAGALAASRPVVNTSSVDGGQQIRFSTQVTGGVAPYVFAWKSLPGCSSQDLPSFTCTTAKVPSNSSYSVYVNVTDAVGGTTNSPPVPVTVAPDPALSPVRAVPSSIDSGQTVLFNTTATGGSGTYTFTWTGLPTGCLSQNLSALSCTPSVTKNASFLVNVTVEDTHNFTVVAPPLTYTVLADDQVGPVVASRPSADSGQLVNFTVAVSNGTGVYNISWSGLPAGCVSGNSTILSCQPSVAQNGSSTVSVSVQDSNGFANTTGSPLYFPVYSDPSVSAPSANHNPTDANRSLQLNVTTLGGTGQYTLVWSGLPPGCPTQNSSRLVCSPSQPGNYILFVTATDSNGFTVRSANLSLDVVSDPLITSFTASPSVVMLGNSTTVQVNATGGLVPYFFSYTGAPSLPAGCSTTNRATWNCTPTATGTFDLEVYLKDAEGASVTAFTNLTVRPIPSSSPYIQSFTATPDNFTLGSTTNLSTNVSGGILPYSFSYTGLPGGCSTANSSLLYCTPSVSGNFTVKVTVVDAEQRIVTASLTLTVNPLGNPGGPLIYAYSANPNPLYLGQKTLITVTVSGGTAPYSFAYSGLPLGCLSSNTSNLPCTPTHFGTYTITVTVTDHAGLSTTSNVLVLKVLSKGGTSTPSSPWTFFGGSALVWILLAVAIFAAVLFFALFWARNRDQEKPSTSDQEPEAPSPGSDSPLPPQPGEPPEVVEASYPLAVEAEEVAKEGSSTPVPEDIYRPWTMKVTTEGIEFQEIGPGAKPVTNIPIRKETPEGEPEPAVPPEEPLKGQDAYAIMAALAKKAQTADSLRKQVALSDDRFAVLLGVLIKAQLVAKGAVRKKGEPLYSLTPLGQRINRKGTSQEKEPAPSESSQVPDKKMPKGKKGSTKKKGRPKTPEPSTPSARDVYQSWSAEVRGDTENIQEKKS